MKISELIAWLEAQKKKHGDIAVEVDDGDIRDAGVFGTTATGRILILSAHPPE